MSSLPLQVPQFARLDEYFGLWAVEGTRFNSLWEMARGMDLRGHVAAAGRGAPVTSTTQKVATKGDQSVAVIKAVGTLMKQQSSMGGTSTIQLRRDIRQAAADPTVSGILIAIDSPGGTVAGTADLVADVKAASKRKPVWAHIDDLGASAAYWLASQADMIYANNATALVGSIGTLWVLYDESGAMEQAGIKTVKIATGPLKGIGAGGTAITEEHVAHLVKLTNETQSNFDAAVMKGRGLTKTQLETVRTGGVFTAPEALGLRLIDGIQSLDATLAALAKAA